MEVTYPVCVCVRARSIYRKEVLRAFKSSNANLGVKACGLVPVLRNVSALQESVVSLPARGEGTATGSVMWPLHLDPPSVFSNWQMEDPDIGDLEM